MTLFHGNWHICRQRSGLLVAGAHSGLALTPRIRQWEVRRRTTRTYAALQEQVLDAVHVVHAVLTGV